MCIIPTYNTHITHRGVQIGKRLVQQHPVAIPAQFTWCMTRGTINTMQKLRVSLYLDTSKIMYVCAPIAIVRSCPREQEAIPACISGSIIVLKRTTKSLFRQKYMKNISYNACHVDHRRDDICEFLTNDDFEGNYGHLKASVWYACILMSNYVKYVRLNYEARPRPEFVCVRGALQPSRHHTSESRQWVPRVQYAHVHRVQGTHSHLFLRVLDCKMMYYHASLHIFLFACQVGNPGVAMHAHMDIILKHLKPGRYPCMFNCLLLFLICIHVLYQQWRHPNCETKYMATSTVW